MTVSKKFVAQLVLACSLVPFTLGPASANYLFVLLLVLFPIVSPSAITVRQAAMGLVAIAAFLWGLPFNAMFAEGFDGTFAARQLLSFGSFMAAAALVLSRSPLTSRDVVGVVTAVAVFYSSLVIGLILFVPGLDFTAGAELKILLQGYLPGWPQRFPILLMFCLLAGLPRVTRSPWSLGATALLTACLALTFTRAVYLGTIAGLGFLVVSRLVTGRAGHAAAGPASTGARVSRRARRRFRVRWALSVSGLVLLWTVSGLGWSDVTAVYALVQDGATQSWRFVAGGLPEPDRLGSSEAQRLYHWREALGLWSESPVFGTGFAGLYLFSDLGSSHGQYIDVLLRMGLLGLLTYFWVWAAMMRWYAATDHGIAAGLFAVFAYGLFHETTKLPYVACLFFLLAAPALARRPRAGSGDVALRPARV